MSDSWYYQYMNLDSTIRQDLVKGTDLKYYRYLHDIVNTSITLFKYEGLEDNLTTQIIETALCFCNNLCFYKSPKVGLILGRYVSSSDYDIYWKPKRVTVLALSGQEIATNVPYENIVILRDNTLDMIPYLSIKDYINKVTYLDDAIMKITTIGTLPLGIIGNKKQALAFKKVANNLGYNNPFIIGDEQMLDSVKSFNINVPLQPNDLYELKRKYLNECYASLGINSVNEKKERVISSEVSAINEYADFVYRDRLSCRKQAIEEINKQGYNINIVESWVESMEQQNELTNEVQPKEDTKDEQSKDNV